MLNQYRFFFQLNSTKPTEKAISKRPDLGNKLWDGIIFFG